MRNRFQRLLLKLLVVLLLAGVLPGCAAKVSDPAIEFLNYLQNRQYPRIYKLLSNDSIVDLTLADMVDRYDTIQSGLGIQSMEYEIVNRTQVDNGAWDVAVLYTFHLDQIQHLELGGTLRLVLRDNVWKLQWDDSMFFPGLEKGDRISIIKVGANRGEIFDKNGKLLAENVPAVSVYADLNKITDIDSTVRLLAPLLDMTETEVRKKIAPETVVDIENFLNRTPAPTSPPAAAPTAALTTTGSSRLIVVKAISPDDFNRALEDPITAIPGIGIEESTFTVIRRYPYGKLLSHVLGYTGFVTLEDLSRPENAGLTTDAIIGKAGLEKEYEMTLRGSSGIELSTYSATGTKKNILYRKDAVDGSDLRLTVDADLQQFAECTLMEYLTDEMSGCVIVIDPTTGHVLTEASAPSYDPNDFTMGLSQEQWAYMQDPVNRLPLYDRTTLGLYPPGSIFKPFTAAMALETEALTADFAFDQSRIVRNTWSPDDIRWTYPAIRRVSKTPDPMNLYNSIVNSDNIYFAYAAMQVGETNFREYCTKYTFGKPFEYDLPVSTSRISNTISFTSIKVLADSGYGQGEMLITPLQMTCLFSAWANKGNIIRPRVVQRIARTENHTYITIEEFTPQYAYLNLLEQSTLNTLIPALRGVITARVAGASLDIAGWDICGKTGTAQVGSANDREIAWMIAFNTAGSAPLLVCVALEVPADQGGIRRDIERAVFRKAIEIADAEAAAASGSPQSPA